VHSIVPSALEAALTKRVLFVGNSLTHRLREYDLPLVIQDATVTIDPHFHTNCGQSLANTLENPYVTCGALKAPYTDGSIYDALGGEPWSAIVFQPFSGTAHSELEAIKTMIDIHRCAYPDNRPEIYLYATWPGRPEATVDGFRSLWERETFAPSAGFQRDRKGLEWIYRRLSRDFPEWSVHYIGVGNMLAEIERNIEAGELPTLGSIRQIFADDIHHGNVGHWIAAQSMISAILSIPPEKFNDAYSWYNNTASGYGMRVLDLPSAERNVIKWIIASTLAMDPEDELPTLNASLSESGDQFEIRFQSTYDQNYIVAHSSDLSDWQPLEAVVGEGSDGALSYATDAPSGFFKLEAPTADLPQSYYPEVAKLPELTYEFEPADLNHIIVAGQSNAVGYNAVHGDPITTTQPYDNVMFSPLLLWSYFATSNEASSFTDTSILDYNLWIGSGLRAPTSLTLTVNVNGSPVFWGPGGKTTTTWQYERYRQTLQGVGFQPLHESLEQDDQHAESFASTICNALTRRTGARFFGSVSGIGGATLYMLDARKRSGPESYPYRNTVDLSTFAPELDGYYGTGAFAQTLAQVERAKQLAAAEGLSYKVAAIVWSQGESDNANSGYANSFSAMVNYYNTCIKAITGQLEDVYFFTDSITYNHSFAGQAGILTVDQQLEVAHEDSGSRSNSGRVYAAGPRYPYNPSTHYAPQSVVAKGEVVAQVIERVLFRRRPWEPLSIKSVSAHATHLDCQFHVPVPPLQWGMTQSNSTSQPISSAFSVNYGFEVKNAFGTSIVTSVSLISPSKVRIHCSEDPAAATLSYGTQVLGGGSALRGNLCDSHGYPSLFTDAEGEAFDARNWAMPFVVQVEE
jgi:hypothetical protein